MRAAIYEVATGKIKRFVETIPAQLALQCQDGEEFYLNCPTTATHIINNQPETHKVVPSVSTDDLVADIRLKRNLLLNNIDLVHCNAERWAAMTPTQQQAWRDYKQQLRDFPALCDPVNPTWPTSPG